MSAVIGMDFVEDGRAFCHGRLRSRRPARSISKEPKCSTASSFEKYHGELPPAIAFRLRGTKSNRDAIGAAITLEPALPANALCFRLARVFFRSTARMCSSALDRSRDRCAPRFAGPAAWCRNCTIFRSIIGSGWKRDAEPSRMEPFKARVKKYGSLS